jgi:hypothetical protein
MVEKLFILGGNPRRKSRRPAARRLFRRARRNPAPGVGDPIPASLKKGMRPIRDAQARRRSKRGGLRAGSPEALAWGRKMKRARYKKAHPSAKRTKSSRRSVARKTIRKGVRHMAKRRRKGGFAKGSPKAKAWGRKMKRLKAAKHTGKKHVKRHAKKTVVRHYKKHAKRSGRRYHKRTQLRKIMVPARYGKRYRKSGWKRIKVLSNPSGKLFSWLKFGALVTGGFAFATVVNKLFNKYVMPTKPQPATYTGLGLSVLAILFGKKLWKQMPESFVTGIVANTMVSAIAQFAPSAWLEWVIPSGVANLGIEPAPKQEAFGAYIPSGKALMDYGNPYDTYGGEANPLMASPFAGANY